MKKIYTIFLILVCPYLQIFGGTFVVDNSADSGPGTLRQAVLDANSQAGQDTIIFDVTTNGNPLLVTTGGDLIVDESLVVIGNGSDQTIIQDDLSAGGASTFTINAGNLEVQDIQFTQFYNAIKSSNAGYQITTTRCSFVGSAGSNLGIAPFYSKMYIDECTFESLDNWAIAGELYIDCIISNSTFSNCSTGAIGLNGHSSNIQLEIFNSTFVNNGNAISISLSYDLQVGKIYNNTIYNNSTAINITEDLNGTMSGFGNSIQLVNNIISSNTHSLYIFNNNFSGAFGGNPIASYNICDGGIQTSPYGAITWSITSDPLLDPSGLIDNGGSTQTVAILTGSPAIDAADPSFAPVEDQRLYGRSGVADIGAFEFNGVSCVVASTPIITTVSTSVCQGSSATLNIAGSLNDDTHWTVYTGSCGGSLLGTTSGNTFDVTPVSPSTSYYIRGEGGGCLNTASCGDILINVNNIDDPSFNYSAAIYCADDVDPTPVVTGTLGGIFTFAPAGLVIDGNSGQIDLDASSPQIYTVTYTTTGACPATSDQNVEVVNIPNAYLRYADRGDIMSSFSQNFYSTYVSGATQFEWRFTAQGTGQVTTVLMPGRRITLAEAGLLDVNQTYDVEVRAYINGVTCSYARSYELTSPSGVPNASLRFQDRGKVLTSFSEVFYTSYVAGASSYDIEFTPQSGGAPVTVNTPNRAMTLNDAGLLDFGETYDVRVRAYVNGQQGSYSSIHTISSPVGVPNAYLRSADRGKTLSSYNENFYSSYVAGASQYEFLFTPQGGGGTVTAISSNRAMTLDFAGLLIPNVTYDVQIRATVNGQTGNYANVFTITSPSVAALVINDNNPNELFEKTTIDQFTNGIDEDLLFETAVYPNPFEQFVSVDFGSNVCEKEIKFYNSVGQLTKVIRTSEVFLNLDLNDLNAGVYMMHIAAEGQAKVIRLVKY